MSAIMRMSAGEYQALQDRHAAEQEWIDKRGKELKAQYAADLEHISDALGDLSHYKVGSRHVDPKTLPILQLIRDQNDHCELGRLLCEAVNEWLGRKADDDAELEFDMKEDL